MEHLRCVVERITYKNEENGYTVIKCRAKGFAELVTVVGLMPDVHVGSVLSLGGQWRINGKYGRQFSVESFEETLPATVYGIEKYLGSGLVKGVGPKFARRIVEKFGKDTLKVIDETPDLLVEVEGIGEVRVERIKKSWTEQRLIKYIMLFLQEHDVSTAHATKIFKAYGEESIEIVSENPYRLADDIYGMGFRTADTIAEKLGFGKERYARIRSGILYSLNQLANDGHCYATSDMLVEKATELLQAEDSLVVITLDHMKKEKDVIVESIPSVEEKGEEQNVIYLPPFFFSELGVARRIARLLAAPSGIKVQMEHLEERMARSSGLHYDRIQIEAIKAAVSHKVFILTGGPGTGKTTTTQGIITAFQESGAQILLAAPTGRAAKRLSEATGMEAKTIHRLLEAKPPEGYKHNEENPLSGDVLIVDECSMIDIILMYNLLKAMPDSMTLVMVGDADQLPSVGAGNVLSDMIASGVIPMVRLERIFRQAMGSRIITNAHRINKGQPIDLSGGKDADFFFDEREDPSVVAEVIVKYCKKNLPHHFKVSPIHDIQVLTPMQRGEIGAVNLNQKLQEALNPGSVYLRRGGIQYRLKDKVMQVRNDYDKEVFNGDIGFITKVDLEERELTVDFEGREVVYDVSELDELVLAYATTIHKSQGSEYPIVVMPFMMSHYIMLQRNLLYTGVTRAKKIIMMVGQKKAIHYAIQNDKAVRRNTRLAERLVEEIRPNGNRKPDIFKRLSRSEFRSRFHLSEEDKDYVEKQGMDVLRSHAKEIIEKRLADASPKNDGKQTPMRGHPVFIGQHATATCCRGCMEKWHGIPKGRALTMGEQEHIADIVMEWIKREMNRSAKE